MVLTKWCSGCEQTLPLEAFYGGKRPSYRCKTCTKKVYSQWRLHNADKYNAAKRAWNAKHGRDGHLRRRYAMSREEYEQLLAEQGGVCALCGQPESVPDRVGNPRPLGVDHDHVTGKVRGLLCHHCNAGLGHFKDDAELLARPTAYLNRP